MYSFQNTVYHLNSIFFIVGQNYSTDIQNFTSKEMSLSNCNDNPSCLPSDWITVELVIVLNRAQGPTLTWAGLEGLRKSIDPKALSTVYYRRHCINMYSVSGGWVIASKWINCAQRRAQSCIVLPTFLIFRRSACTSAHSSLTRRQ